MKRFFQNPMAIMLVVVMAANSFLSGRFDNPLQWLLSTVLIFPGIFIGISLHEFSHAFVAYKLGDMTPKNQGRVSLNPFRHIDIVGLLALVVIGFGWGKAVEINPYAFKHPRRDNFLVDIAGIVTNFIIAILFTGLLKFISYPIMYHFSPDVSYILIQILRYVVQMNLVLMIFNLLPVPPLDGFGIVTEIFNLRGKAIYYRIYNLGFPILMVLMLFGVTGKVMMPILSALLNFLSFIWGF